MFVKTSVNDKQKFIFFIFFGARRSADVREG